MPLDDVQKAQMLDDMIQSHGGQHMRFSISNEASVYFLSPGEINNPISVADIPLRPLQSLSGNLGNLVDLIINCSDPVDDEAVACAIEEQRFDDLPDVLRLPQGAAVLPPNTKVSGGRKAQRGERAFVATGDSLSQAHARPAWVLHLPSERLISSSAAEAGTLSISTSTSCSARPFPQDQRLHFATVNHGLSYTGRTLGA